MPGLICWKTFAVFIFLNSLLLSYPSVCFVVKFVVCTQPVKVAKCYNKEVIKIVNLKMK